MAQAEQWTPRVRRVTGDERGRLMYANALMREKRFDEARTELESVLHQNEASFGGNLSMGLLCQVEKNFRDSLSYFDRAMRAEPMRASAPFFAGISHLALKDAERAQTMLESSLNIDPKSPRAHMWLAQALQRQGKFEDAEGHLADALLLDPHLLRARLMLARMYYKSGQVDAAIGELDTVLRMHPRQREATIFLAMLQSEQGQADKAAALLEGVTKQNRDDVGGWALLGRVRMRVPDYAGAEAAFREAMRIRPRRMGFRLQLIEALVQQGKLDEARELLDKMPRRRPLGALVHKFYGDIYHKKKMFADAVESYRAAILNSRKGEEAYAAVEKKIGAIEGADDKKVAELLRKSVSELMEEARKGFLERGWEYLGAGAGAGGAEVGSFDEPGLEQT